MVNKVVAVISFTLLITVMVLFGLIIGVVL